MCFDHVNEYTCICQSGYTGYDCDVDIDECQSSPCVHGKHVYTAVLTEIKAKNALVPNGKFNFYISFGYGK